MDTTSKAKWLKRRWPLLVARWVVLGLVVGGIAFATGAGLTASALLGLALGGVLNIAWCWVA